MNVLIPTDEMPWWRHATVLALFVLALVLLIARIGYAFWPHPGAVPVAVVTATITATPSPLPTVPATATSEPSATPAPPPQATALPTPQIPTPMPGGFSLALTPAANAVGWVSNLTGRGQFNDPNIHVGYFNGHTYYGVMQFDLSRIPPGSRITFAALELVGLSDRSIGETGTWQVQMLEPGINEVWSSLTYNLLDNAPTTISILPTLGPAELAQDRVNFLPFGPEQLEALQQQTAHQQVAFQIVGPTGNNNNLFTWDTGLVGARLLQGLTSDDEVVSSEQLRLTRQPILWVVTDRQEFVIVTSTPTPKNILTAVAQTTSTPTPPPAEWATPIVVTVPPPPGNAATATYQERIATAEAIAYGTPTLTPVNVWTATPTPPRVMVTSTPTPDNVVTAMAVAARATQFAETVGTFTPVPSNWATPFVVTPRPEPRTEATAQLYRAEATAEAFLYGLVCTATPTSIFATPVVYPTPTPTPGYAPVPDVLVNKIAFLSDRQDGEGRRNDAPIYVMDPDGSNVWLLSGSAFYESALERDKFSADQRYRTFVRTDASDTAIYMIDSLYNAEKRLTYFGYGIAWHPVWSPTAEKIAFISNDSADDEIWTTGLDWSQVRQLTEENTAYNAARIGKDDFIPEVNRHPSWSPDGSQIVFWSNRTGNAQIWVMDADGSNQRIISHNNYNDWNPVWIKYTDAPPLLPE